ncbi:bifunctional UDP-sugar hydrolase/5'-nucleotidase [Corynebacterium sp. LK2536]|uniref:bifunctional UDP-sugar hydrolase/5'-nucleotidase n=2 Tax=unclassified Corynebacterium TaxID=2624378 RepID=UPI0034CD5DDE
MSNFRRIGRLVAATTVTAVALQGAPAAFAEDKVSFSVSNFTDFHGHLEEADPKLGAAKLMSLVEQVNQDQNYDLTTSGDNVGGSAFVSAITDDEYTLQVLNDMGVEASAVGNHEFDQGFDDLTGRIIPKSDYPVLGANVLKDGQPAMEASHVSEIDGVKVGYVGTVTQLTAEKVAPSAIEGITFTDPVEATNKEATRLKESGEADVVVALMHEDAEQYAEGFNNDVDVLFGGDSHVRSQGTVEREGALPLHWAQGHEYGKVLNDVDFTYDKTAGELTDVELTQYDYTDAAALEPHAEIAGLVAEAKDKAAEKGAEEAGETPQAMFRGSDEGKEPGSNRGVESTLNNFIAEGQRVSMSKQVDKDIDLGLMNAGGVRADLKGGKVTYQDIFEVQPFGNSIAYGTITGQDLVDALENQWQPGNSRPRLALGLSENVSVAYDPQAEQGERVQSVIINGEPLDLEKNYTVALLTFLAGGGDGFFAEDQVKDIVDVGYMDTQAMIDFIASGEADVRTGQGQVGVHLSGEPKAGEKLTVELSSLNYTSEGEPMAKTATVSLGEATAEAEIDNARQDGDDQMGERGRATVELTVPADLSGEQELKVTTDQGTEVIIPVTVGAADGNGNDGDDNDDDTDNSDNGSSQSSTSSLSSGSSDSLLSSVGIGAGVIVALVAGLMGAIGTGIITLPAPVRKMIEDLRKQFGL